MTGKLGQAFHAKQDFLLRRLHETGPPESRKALDSIESSPFGISQLGPGASGPPVGGAAGTDGVTGVATAAAVAAWPMIPAPPPRRYPVTHGGGAITGCSLWCTAVNSRHAWGIKRHKGDYGASQPL